MQDNIVIYCGLVVFISFVIIVIFAGNKKGKKGSGVKSPHGNPASKNSNNTKVNSVTVKKEPEQKSKQETEKQLRKLLLSLLNELSRLGKTEQVEELKKKTDALIQTLDSPLLVSVLGEFSSGKSTFINALIDEKILAMKVKPTTATITKLQYGAKKRLEVNFKDGIRKEFGTEDLHTLTVENFVNEKNILDDIAYVQLELNNEFLRSIDLADTPGFNSNLERHSQITADFINHSDIILWLFDANQLEKKTTFELIQKHCKYSKPVGIINKIDQITEENSEEEARQYIQELINTIKPFTEKVFAVSSKMGLNEETKGMSGITEIKKYFTTQIIPGAFKTKKLIIGSKLTGIAIEINHIRESLKEITEKQKIELEKFRKSVAKYERDLGNYEQSIKNWNNDIEKLDFGQMLKNLNRYFMVNGTDKNILTRAAGYHDQYDQLLSNNKRINLWFDEIARNRTKLENEYSVWLSAYTEYDSKFGKKILDGIWNFFSGNDITEEKIKLNNLEYQYSSNEAKFNQDVEKYNSFRNSTIDAWDKLEDSSLDFINNVVKVKLEAQCDYVQKQLIQIQKMEPSMKKLESDYSTLLRDLRVYDDNIYNLLYQIYQVLVSNELTKQQSQISNFESLITNYKKYNDGYVNLDWKELYSRNKINAVISSYNSSERNSASATAPKNIGQEQRGQVKTTIRV